MPTLHLLCDFREPSLSRAVQEARQLPEHQPQVDHLRAGGLAATLLRLSETMKPNDSALLALLHTHENQLSAAAEVMGRLPNRLRSRLTLCASRYSPALRQWAADCNLKYQDNPYEAPRKASWRMPLPPSPTSLNERCWIHYRLMRALIAGEDSGKVYEQIITKLRQGMLTEKELRRALTFHERGEPDMAGGNYAEERRANPNAIDRLRDRAVEVGRSGLNTIIVGETGTGKESLAWYVHDFSARGDQPFLALNCAFFEGERLESELFGHKQGAFTDAKRAKRGLVEEADGGTLFLDELPEMAPRVQAKLLRFLQDGSYTRLGGNRALRANVRVISAAQPGLLQNLRPDLYFRLADVELHTVALREMMPRDIVNIGCNLAYRLIWTSVMREDSEIMLTPEHIRAVWRQLAEPDNSACLAAYSWPGNMREFSTLIKRYVLLGDDIFSEIRQRTSVTKESALSLAILDEEWRRFLLPVASPADIISRGLKLKNLQAAYIRNLVANLGGRAAIQPTKLADALGCSYNTLSGCLQSDEAK